MIKATITARYLCTIPLLLLWLVIGLCPPAVAQDADSSAAAPLVMRSAGHDPLLGADKFSHLTASAFVTSAQIFTLQHYGDVEEKRAVAIAATSTMVLGIAKEVYDKASGKGTASFKDMLANVAGIAVVVLLFYIE